MGRVVLACMPGIMGFCGMGSGRAVALMPGVMGSCCRASRGGLVMGARSDGKVVEPLGEMRELDIGFDVGPAGGNVVGIVILTILDRVEVLLDSFFHGLIEDGMDGRDGPGRERLVGRRNRGSQCPGSL